jgi:hypothetical protein
MSADNFSRDAQRYLDGEPHGELDGAERAAADGLRRSGRALRERLMAPSAALEDRVMAAVRAEPRARRSPLAWIVEPRTVRLRPVWVPVAAAAALALWVLGRQPRTELHMVAPAPLAQVSDTVFVHFELFAPEARAVSLAGDFNEWRPDGVRLVRSPAGAWSVTIPLRVGEHRYQFVVDGERWIPDPSGTGEDDGFGGRNSVIVVGPKGVART